MKINKAEIVAVTADPRQYPPDNMPEVALAGRSNVGKSSLLNLLTGRKKLAKVSGSPGKTRTINFYEINGRFRIADLPGYGYAKVSRSMSDDWGRMMDQYFMTRESLIKVVLLVDIRHEPSAQDVQMYEYMKHYELDGIIAATKADKLSNNQINRSLSVIRKTLEAGPDARIIPVSSLKKTGCDELMGAIVETVLNK